MYTRRLVTVSTGVALATLLLGACATTPTATPTDRQAAADGSGNQNCTQASNKSKYIYPPKPDRTWPEAPWETDMRTLAFDKQYNLCMNIENRDPASGPSAVRYSAPGKPDKRLNFKLGGIQGQNLWEAPYGVIDGGDVKWRNTLAYAASSKDNQAQVMGVDAWVYYYPDTLLVNQAVSFVARFGFKIPDGFTRCNGTEYVGCVGDTPAKLDSANNLQLYNFNYSVYTRPLTIEVNNYLDSELKLKTAPTATGLILDPNGMTKVAGTGNPANVPAVAKNGDTGTVYFGGLRSSTQANTFTVIYQVTSGTFKGSMVRIFVNMQPGKEGSTDSTCKPVQTTVAETLNCAVTDVTGGKNGVQRISIDVS